MLASLMELALRLGAALTIFFALGFLFVRAPKASLALVLFTTVLTESREWPLPSSLEIATFNVSIFDVFTVLLGMVALYRIGWQRVERPGRGAMLVIAGLTALGLLTWTLTEGLQVSVNFWRQWMFPIAACWYTASWPVLRTRWGLQPYIWAALLGSLTQALGIALRGFGSNSDAVLVGGELVGARPITASVALLILFGAVLLLLDRGRGPLGLVLSAWLWLSVLIAQHRSVWVSGIVAAVFLALTLVNGSRQRLVTATLAVIGLIGVGLLTSAVVSSQAQLSSASTDVETLQWRIENWTEKLTVVREPYEWLLGSVLGPTTVTERFDSTLEFQVSAHSMLLDVLSSLGIVGVLAVVLVAIAAVRVPRRRGDNHWVLPASLVAYGFFYSWPLWSWLVLGAITSRRPPGSVDLRHTSKRDPGLPVAPFQSRVNRGRL